MFGPTTPFGQSSSSPFGSPSGFGQTNNATTNLFAPNPFGSTSPFGSQTSGSSVSGVATPGVYGTPQSSTPAFGASSTPAFGSSMPAFGASSAPSFGGASPSFGGSSLFGQKPAFGGFGSSSSQNSSFATGFQQTQPAFGSNMFGSSSPFGASSQPAFGTSSSPAFGATSTPAFGATSTPAFGATSTPAFGVSSTPAFGSTTTPTFGSTGSAFGVSSAPVFGSSSTPAFGASSTPVFGSSSTSAFGTSSTPAFGSTSTPAFGGSSTPFSFGSASAFGQTTSSTFVSTPFGSNSSPFGAQSSPFGTQTPTPGFGSPGFGQSAFGGQRGGSRVAPYTPTAEVDGGTGTQPAGKLESISAMPVYKEKSHEELRWEDYQLGDKGGPNLASQPASGISFNSATQPSPFGQSTGNPFSSTTSSNPFTSKTHSFGSSGFGASSASSFSSAFGTSSSGPFGTATSASTASIFGPPSTAGFGATSSQSPFGPSNTTSFTTSPSIFGSSALGSNATFGSGLTFSNTQSSGLFPSSTTPVQTTSAFGQNTAFGQMNPFNTPASGFGGNLFSSNSTPTLSASNLVGFGQTTSSLTTPFTSATPPQSSGGFSFSNFGQTQTAPSSGFGGASNVFGQGTFGQSAPSQSNMAMQPVPVTNPFGTLPQMPQMLIGRTGSAPSVQYGISSIPVADKPAPVRISSLLTSRHLSQRRIRLPARKYHPNNDRPKVPFFVDDEEVPSTPKADAFFIPRENPRTLVIRPMEQWPPRTSTQKQSLLKDMSSPVRGNESVAEDGFDKHRSASTAKPLQKQNGIHEDHGQKGDSYITISGHRAGEAAIVYEHGADIEALMPKLRHSDYYTEPRIQELAAKERAEPGYCRHVKDFVVGRHGYGFIKFTGETDVRRLDLEAIIQFNNKEVLVYTDDSKKPPVGQGLNKPAELTLLNIKFFNKKSGEQYTEGLPVEKYREMLRKKNEDQGAEFVSYDPVKGEWKFKVNHF